MKTKYKNNDLNVKVLFSVLLFSSSCLASTADILEQELQHSGVSGCPATQPASCGDEGLGNPYKNVLSFSAMRAAAVQNNLAELVTKMEGKDSTNKWDVICSYTVDQLNSFLASQYSAGKLAQEVKLSTTREDPFTGGTYTIVYDILFASPKLSFNTERSGSAILDMPIQQGSSYTIKENGRKTDIPATYTVQAVVPLAAVKGDTGPIIEADNIITFSDNNKENYHIITHFSSSTDTSFNIVPTPDLTSRDVLQTYFLPVLQNYFKTEVKEIEYVLSSINNEKAPAGALRITPKSFVFSSAPSGNGGILSLYIQTAESGTPPGNERPSFQPGDTAATPVPNGYTASLILSYNLVTNYLLKPQLLEKYETVTFIPASKGIEVQLTSSKSVIALGNDHGTSWYGAGHTYEGLNAPIDSDHPLDLKIADSQVTLQWKAAEVKSRWYSGSYMGSHGSGNWGEVYFRLSLSKGPINFAKLDDHQMSLFNIAITSSDIKVDKYAHDCGWKIVLKCLKSWPPFYDNGMTFQVPDISVKMKGLDFFATTNLLAPGEHVINFDTSQGVKTPHDFILVGNVVKK